MVAFALGVSVFSGSDTLKGPFLYDDRGTVKVNPVVSEPATTPWTEVSSAQPVNRLCAGGAHNLV